MPPFGRLAAIIVSAEDRPRPRPSPGASATPRPTVEGMAVFGPAPAPLAMLRGRHRQRLLVHAAPQPRRPGRHPRLARRRSNGARKVRVSVDVDPYSFLDYLTLITRFAEEFALFQNVRSC